MTHWKTEKMITIQLYSLCGLILFAMGFFALIVCAHLLRKILAINVMSAGVFLFIVATAYQPAAPENTDPVPLAMVLTGIVVSVSVTALALILACLVIEKTNPSIIQKSSTKKLRERKK